MQPEYLNKVGHSSQTAAQRLNVRSALNPMLWLCGITTPVMLIAAFLFKDVELIRNLLIIIGLFPTVVTCLGFIGFAIFKPEKLQSEDYQLRHQSLQIIQQKVGILSVDTRSLEALAIPPERQLHAGENEER